MSFADELQEALDTIEPEGEITCEEMSLFLSENPVVLAIADELGSFTEALSFLDEATEIIGDFPTQGQAVRLFEKVHSPFKRKDSLTLDAAVKGEPNPRTNVKDWDCQSDGKYKQKCTKLKDPGKGGTRTIDMTDYYGPDKAEYMRNWRKKTRAEK